MTTRPPNDLPPVSDLTYWVFGIALTTFALAMVVLIIAAFAHSYWLALGASSTASASSLIVLSTLSKAWGKDNGPHEGCCKTLTREEMDALKADMRPVPTNPATYEQQDKLQDKLQAYGEYRAHGGKLDFTAWEEKRGRGGVRV